MNFIYTVLAIDAILFFKIYFTSRNRYRAINYIYSQTNWRELKEKYLYDKSFWYQIFNPIKWTYKQQFKGLEDEKMEN